MENGKQIAIIGVGNMGTSIALGLVQSGLFRAQDIVLTRSNLDHLTEVGRQGFIWKRTTVRR
jgi:pyrroline-5-carboxylate reductase